MLLQVLHFLESQKPADAFQLLLPALVHAVVSRLGEEWREELSPLSTLHSLQEKASRLTSNLTPNVKELSVRLQKGLHLIQILFSRFFLQRLVEMIAGEEAKVAQLKSLKEKFEEEAFLDKQQELSQFLCDMLKFNEVEVPEGPTGVFGQRVRSMFLQAQRVKKKC